jgi:DNA-binding NarL/FixJ family response regulator
MIRPLSSGATEQATAPACPRPLRVVLLESHQLFRECLAAALRDDAGFAGVEVMDLDQLALARLAAGDPVDVLLLGGDGDVHELLREARRRLPDVKVVVLGAEDAQDEALALLREGARGYLFHDQSLDELRDAIVEVAAGATVCAPRIAHLLFSRLSELGNARRRDERLDFLELTARELEILQLIADGLQNQEIAARLYLSVHTVKNHVHKILERLGVKSRWSAVKHASEKGWLQPKRRFPS